MLIAIAVVCTLFEAVFSALEVALSAVSRARLRTLAEAEPAVATASGASSDAPALPPNADPYTPALASGGAGVRPAARRRAARVLRLLQQPERLTLVFITVTSLSMWTAASALAWESLATDWPGWVLPVALIGVLFVAEVPPLLLAAHKPEGIALKGAPVVEASLMLLSPLLMVVGGIGHGVARMLGAGPGVTPQVTEGELRSALATAEEEGVIESDERAMLEGAMEFRDKLVREIMTPRIDIVGVPAQANLLEALHVAMREGHSRLPVYDGTVDKITGILATRDLLPYLRQDGAGAHSRVDAVARPPFFVPEYKRIAPTLEELRHQRSLMAIVVDADGGTAGLVTLEDLLEEIVGEIQDEYDIEEPALRVVAGGETPTTTAPNGDAETGDVETDEKAAAPPTRRTVLCDAGVTVREFERFWRKSFRETVSLRDASGAVVDASLSLAALALQLFESVPGPGDQVRAGSVTSRGADAPTAAGPPLASWLELEVVSMDGPRIEEVKIEKVIAAEGDGGSQD